jgi:hypothetical protein
MPHVVTRTTQFQPWRWVGFAALACGIAFTLGLGYGQHDSNQATAKTVTATVTAPAPPPSWCAGASSKPFGQFVDDGTVPGSALYVEYRAESVRMQGFGVQGSVDPGAMLLTLALRCY